MATTKKAPSKKKSPAKKAAAKRTLIEPHAGDKRYIRRTPDGQIKESDDVTKSLSQDVRNHATTVSKSGQGDKGDAKKATSKKRSAT